MKAITLWQPWASLMALGHKTIETRSWSTNYRGPLAIHAAKKVFIPPDPEFVKALEELNINVFALPTGCILGVCNLWNCIQVEDNCGMRNGVRFERLFGDYSPGRYLWLTNKMEALKKPTRCAGKQGLWDWEGGTATNPQPTR